MITAAAGVAFSIQLCIGFAYVDLQGESVSESLMFGWPHILVPLADSFDSMREMQENEQSLLALCQVQSSCVQGTTPLPTKHDLLHIPQDIALVL